jgi:hypothetical protein
VEISLVVAQDEDPDGSELNLVEEMAAIDFRKSPYLRILRARLG